MRRQNRNASSPRQTSIPLEPSADAPTSVAPRSGNPSPEPSGTQPSIATDKPSVAPPSVKPDDGGAEPAVRKPARRATAEMMAAKQREISVSEFFTKNRHLLGFDNPAKALLTAIKEAVDNSLDACEEAGILPDIIVEVDEVSDGRYRVAVQDNGPGIVRAQVPKIFAKLLYGSKFHHLKQSRGQQGIGISAAGLYAQLTTGKAVVITSKTAPGRPARRIELRIDTRHNKPEVLSDTEMDWEVDHGTRVEMELAGTYRGGRTSIDAYLEQTVIANPHLSLTYKLPKMDAPVVFERATHELPREPLEIRPHPHGVELGLLIRMMHEAGSTPVRRVLVESFSRVSASIAEQVCEAADVPQWTKAASLTGDQIEAIHKALATVKVMAPPASCVVPIGSELLEAGLRRRFEADFYCAVTRPPSVYRGNPFVVECGIAYGGKLPPDEPADVMRFANRVPLQYQPKACAMTEAVYQTNWKAYALQQPKGSLPIGPLAVVLHLASVWVPFTNEAKEAVAHYPELLREMRLAIQEAGRRLATHLRAQHRAEHEKRRRSVFERYIPELGASLAKITSRDPAAITQTLLDALPEFVNIPGPNDDDDADARFQAEASTASDGPGVPSMPPPADVEADEPPDSQRASRRKRAAAARSARTGRVAHDDTPPAPGPERPTRDKPANAQDDSLELDPDRPETPRKQPVPRSPGTRPDGRKRNAADAVPDPTTPSKPSRATREDDRQPKLFR